jgi:hypothetical protein
VDPVPGPLLLRKSGSAGNQTRTSGSVARNSDSDSDILIKVHLVFSLIYSFKIMHFNLNFVIPLLLHTCV